jgi:hypothetical protein
MREALRHWGGEVYVHGPSEPHAKAWDDDAPVLIIGSYSDGQHSSTRKWCAAADRANTAW